MFNSHINVEVVSSIKSVKYLYKYIYKGHDAATITIEPVTEDIVLDHNEIRDYIEARYVGPVEASWRIFEKKLCNEWTVFSKTNIKFCNEFPSQ